MNVYDVLTPHNYSQTHSVVATSLSEAEKTYLTRYPGARILEIKLHAEYVVVADYGELAQAKRERDEAVAALRATVAAGVLDNGTVWYDHALNEAQKLVTAVLNRSDGDARTKPDEDLYPWHLPSQEVLNRMYEYQDEIGGFASDYYWSSTDSDGRRAWCQYFLSGGQSYDYKGVDTRVRAVRALPSGTAETERLVRYDGVLYQAYHEDAPESMTWAEAIAWCEALNKPDGKP